MLDQDLTDGVSSLVLASSCSPTLLTGTTVAQPLFEITVPALWPGAILRTIVLASFTNNPNNKTLTLRFGGALVTAPTYPGQAATGFGNTLYIREASAVSLNSSSFIGNATLSTITVQPSLPTPLLLQGTLASAADLLTIEAYSVEILGFSRR